MPIFKRCSKAILAAPNERAIRAALLECLSEFQTEISQLPSGCQVALADRDADLNETAFTLLRADMAFTGDTAAAAVLRSLANVYAAASVRATQLHIRAPR